MDLRKKALEAAQHSHSPYSQVKVGSALVTADGSVFSGCNIENSSFGGTVCAERVAIWQAVSAGHRQISQLYVYTDDGWPPCGLCRQVMAEFASADLTIIIGDKKGQERHWKFSDLLPLAFTPDHLIKK